MTPTENITSADPQNILEFILKSVFRPYVTDTGLDSDQPKFGEMYRYLSVAQRPARTVGHS
jgi:hypothetical protein